MNTNTNSLTKNIAIAYAFIALFVTASLSVASEIPSFIHQPLKPNAEVNVVAIKPTSEFDLIFINGGYEQGFRVGSECQVLRNSTKVAELVLVDVRASFSAGLILELNPQTAILKGDTAKIKIQFPTQ